MFSKAFQKAVAKDLPVLFAKIGWSNFYDGTEDILGGSRWVADDPRDNGESAAFLRQDGFFTGFAGHGTNTPDRFHIVFVAEWPLTGDRHIVGIYAEASTNSEMQWMQVTRHAYLIPSAQRPRLRSEWPGNQGIRRWAYRPVGTQHGQLLAEFKRLRNRLNQIASAPQTKPIDLDQTYQGIVEGVPSRKVILSRSREMRLSRAKKAEALAKFGKLTCEVPGCGFDFEKSYGKRYAQVHHKIPLSRSGKSGRKSSLADLMIVCANCHSMIHYGGGCEEDLRNLLERRK